VIGNKREFASVPSTELSREDPMKERFERAATWLPLIVGALLVAIVAVFIFAAPDQITTPNDTGYFMGTPASAAPIQTAMR